MAIPSSGPISLQTIQTEFGGSNPIGINEYYAGGAYVSAGTTGTYGAVPSSGQISIQNFYGTSAHVPFSTKVTYTANSTLVAPYAALRVKMWGASGGSGSSGTLYPTGGCGGYAQADITVTVGNTLLIAVGGGGGYGNPASGGTNGGGSAGSVVFPAGGGGYSGVFANNTASQANAFIMAGGGGGSGSQGDSRGCGIGGGGGTSPSGEGGGGATYNIALQGGGSTSSGTLGGGGGGYRGGAQGTSSVTGGCGGSGYIKSGSTNVTCINGSQGTYNAATNAPNNTDPDYVANKGNISGTRRAGNPGYVVIYY